MGTGSSKAWLASASTCSSSGGAGGSSTRSRPRGVRVFGSSCFGFGPTSSPADDRPDQENVGRSESNCCTDEALAKADHGNHGSCRMVRISHVGKLSTLTTSDIENDVENQESTSRADCGPSSRATSHSLIGEPSSISSHSRPCFGFISDGIGLRLDRAASVGSFGARSFFSASLPARSDNGDDDPDNDYGSSVNGRNENQNNAVTDAISLDETTMGSANPRSALSDHSYGNHLRTEVPRRRRFSRRVGTQEQLQGSVRFSRTLSVGRLRDRVLRRTTYSEGLFGPLLLEGQSAEYIRQFTRRRHSPSSRDRELSLDLGNTSESAAAADGSHEARGYESEVPQFREPTSRDVLEHRSAFLERRRRIRSQVHALQRLGSRHDRSCILSGQHRTGRCTCRTSGRPVNPDEETSTRASISRIVMLAEALFEVLDEIHQQSVTLTSRPSFSSIGSVPAPMEVVEKLPSKVYLKPPRPHSEENAQCYICLVEYDEGDYIRMLPCRHEFHQMCIDKWLKEIHRVCPLCRRDVCRSECTSTENF